MRARRWASTGSLSPSPQITGCQLSPQHLNPPAIRGRQQSPVRWVPYVYVPRRALGNVPGAMPPHLPQHELMCSASPGFTLALPPPAAAFQSHPEGRSLAVLRRRPGPGFVCTLHLVPLSALPGSVRAAVIAAGCTAFFPRRWPPPLLGRLQGSLVRTLSKPEHVLARLGAAPPLLSGSLNTPRPETAPSPEAVPAPPCTPRP